MWIPNGAVITVNVDVLFVIAHSFCERTTPDAPLAKLLLRSCAYLIKFGEVDIMSAELTRQFPDTLNLKSELPAWLDSGSVPRVHTQRHGSAQIRVGDCEEAHYDAVH